MPRVKLDEVTVRKAALPPGKRQYILWCERAPGFGLLLGANTKTWIVQRDLPGGHSRRVTLGRYPDMTLTQARQEAAGQYAAMLNGIDPVAQRRQRVKEQQRKEWEAYTLRQAREHHILDMRAKACSQRSIDDMMESLDLHLSDWMDRPLADITPAEAIERHRKITAMPAPYAANDVLRRFRACYNSARRLYRELPECPATSITYNVQYRRREPVEDLAAWYAKVQTIDNSVRRDYQQFVLLTGLRATDAATVRFSEVNWDDGTLTRPNPKGGPRRAFTIPLSAHVLAMLARRQLDNRKLYGMTDWAFPCIDRAGNVTHMCEPKEQRFAKDDKGKVHKVPFLPSPHRLRDTFISICETEAGIDPITTKALVNHRLPSGDVTTGYVRPALSHMRTCTEKVTAILLAKMGEDAAAQGGQAKKAGA